MTQTASRLSLGSLLIVGLIASFVIGISAYFRSHGQLESPVRSIVSGDDARTEMYTESEHYPMRMNSWFSSLYRFPSDNVFALPASFAVKAKGIEIGMPEVTASANVIMGVHVPVCKLSPTMGEEFKSSKVERYGDWDVTVIVEGKAKNRVQMIEGSAAQYLWAGEDLMLDCGGKLLEQVSGRVMMRHQERILVIDRKDGSLEVSDGKVLLPANGEYRLMVLPKEVDSSLISYPWYEIERTVVNYSFTDLRVNTMLKAVSTGATPLLTVWPHQKEMLVDTVDAFGTYRTSRGVLDLVKSDSLVMSLPVPVLAEQFNALSNDSAGYESLMQKLASDTAVYEQNEIPKGVYFKGTWLGAMATLVQLNQLYGQEAAINILSKRLQSALSEGLSTLVYDSNLQMVIAKNDEFGNKEGNDHHFHYGYYIRAAAVLRQIGVVLSDEDKAKIEWLVKDIASAEQEETPRFRNFNPYQGHSYASGAAPFADGNNQESTSEALNAWYSVYLWGKVNNNLKTEQIGQWLFAQELQATKTYWFGQKIDGYAHEMVSIVWDGKRDFATWFSAEPLHVYGIQWLPLTPASTYLDELPNREAQIAELQTLMGRGVETHEWSDLYAVYLSSVNQDAAKELLPRLKNVNGAKLQVLPWQMVYAEFSQ